MPEAAIMSVVLVDSARERLTLWETFELQEDFLDPLSKFSMTCAPTADRFQEYYQKLSKGKQIEVWVGSHLQFTGMIIDQNVTISSQGPTIQVNASGMLAAAYEASVSPRINLSVPKAVPVVNFIEKVMGPFFSEEKAKVRNDSGYNLELKSGKPITGAPLPIPTSSITAKEMKSQAGQSAYQFCSRLISRLGVILKTDATGQLMLDRPNYKGSALYTLCQSKSTSSVGNYMLDGITISDTNRGQFSEIVVKGSARVKKGSNKAARNEKKIGPDGKPVKNSKGEPVWRRVSEANSRSNTPIARMTNYYTGDPYDDPAYEKFFPNILPYKNVPKRKATSITPLRAAATSAAANLGQRDWTPEDWLKAISEARYEQAFMRNFLHRHLYRSAKQPFKPRYVEDKKSQSIDRCMTMAGLLFGLRNASGFTIKCSVPGFFSTTGYLWTPNTLVRVVIDLLGANDEMWIFGRTFKASRTGGQQTDLHLMPKFSLVLGELP